MGENKKTSNYIIGVIGKGKSKKGTLASLLVVDVSKGSEMSEEIKKNWVYS